MITDQPSQPAHRRAGAPNKGNTQTSTASDADAVCPRDLPTSAAGRGSPHPVPSRRFRLSVWLQRFFIGNCWVEKAERASTEAHADARGGAAEVRLLACLFADAPSRPDATCVRSA